MRVVANSHQSEYRPVKPLKWTLPQGHIPYVCIRRSATLNEAYSSVQGLFLGAHPYRTPPSVPESSSRQEHEPYEIMAAQAHLKLLGCRR